MAKVQKIDSNIVSCRYAVEDSPGTLPTDPVWYPLSVNGFSDFGAKLTTVSRSPLSSSRQRKKGAVVDLDATGSFQIDFTQNELQEIFSGFLLADPRSKYEIRATAQSKIHIQGAAKTITVSGDTTLLDEGSILLCSDFENPVNNGVKIVTNKAGNTILTVGETCDDEESENGKIVNVGFKIPTGKLSVSAGPGLPFYSAGTRINANFAHGEWLLIGGDSADSRFTNPENNGFKRISSFVKQHILIDKTETAPVSEDGAGKSIQIFFGRMFRNEVSTLIRRKTYQIERSLGAPDTSKPKKVQAEYLKGATPSQFTMNIPTAEKITMDFEYIATDAEQINAATGLKAGTRPDLKASSAFNTSSDFRRLNLSEVTTDAVQTPLFAYITDLTLTLNNNVSALKAVGVLGGFDTTVGQLEVGGSLTAYFSDIEAVKAVRDNVSVTFDMIMVKDNSGVIVDLPLITLGNGQVTVTQNEPVTLPLDMMAAEADLLSPYFNYTIMMIFFDYLPDSVAGISGVQ